MPDQVRANQRRAAVLVAGVVIVATLAGSLVGVLVDVALVGLLLGLVIGVALATVAWRTGADRVLRASRAHPADPVTFARLHNLVDGLCVAGGLPKPELYVVDDAAPNALTVGRSTRASSLVVTRGLLDTLSRVELEGVLAHELSHIKAGDVLPATLAASLLGVTGRRSEAMADLAGVRLTRYPPGLIGALEKVRDDDAVVLAGAGRATAHLWFEAPVPGSGADLEQRIEALRDL